MKLLCETMGIQRSSFYSWKKNVSNPSNRTKNLVSNILLFQEYHLKYPSHGYRWLNAKIRLDTGLVLSDPYAYKCCKTAGIKSKAKHYKYKKPGDPFKVFPNLLLSEMRIDGPLQCIVGGVPAKPIRKRFSDETISALLTERWWDWTEEKIALNLAAIQSDRVDQFK